MRSTISLSITLLATLAACAADPADPGPPAAVPTFNTDVRPLLDKSCGGCHVDGGIGPFVFDEYAQAKPLASLIADAVATRRMPPWMPDPSCRSYGDERRLSDAEIGVITAWAANGAPEGGATEAQAAPAIDALPPPTLSLRGEAEYTPTTARTDDYRCFPLVHTFERETYLVRSTIEPDVRSQVHHVLLFLIGPTNDAEFDRVDAADPGPGYTCFGGPGVGVPETIGAWVPGSIPISSGDQAAIRIPAGARIIMQMHYNTASAPPAPDRSAAQLWLTDTPPAYLVKVKPLAHLGLKVAANDPRSLQTRIFTNRDARPWHVVGIAGHMHMLGERIQVRALKAQETACMLDIPRWDFSWQQSYRFLPDEPVIIEPGESVRVDCTYDNSPANQAVVNGVKRPSREVTWGEGTFDEMCLAYLLMIEPFTPLQGPNTRDLCPGFQACYDGCRAQPGSVAIGCALQCSNAVANDRSCTQCVFQSVVSCTIDDCVGEIDGFLQCIDGCATAPDSAACVSQACVGSIVALDTCTAPRVGSGVCDTLTTACGGAHL
jgi:hypothetical protein